MNDLQQGFADIRNAILQKKMMKRDDEQRARQEALRKEMQDYRNQRDQVMDARAGQDFDWNKQRAAVDDARYSEGREDRIKTDAEGARRWALDQAGRQQQGLDNRISHQQTLTAQAGRDAGNDKLKEMEILMRGENAGRGYEQQTVDPETGEVQSITRKLPLGERLAQGMAAMGAGMGGPDVRGAVKEKQTANADAEQKQLLEAVRTGKMTKDEAKAIAKQRGW